MEPKAPSEAPPKKGDYYSVTLEKTGTAFYIPREQHTSFAEVMEAIGQHYTREDIGRIVIDIW